MDNERNDNNTNDNDTFDDDLFDGLSEEDYTPEQTLSDDDDLDEGYVHDTFDNEEELYNYQDDESETESAYGINAGAKKSSGLLDNLKQKLTQGSLSDRLRALAVPVFFIVIIVAYCGYQIMGLLAPAPVVQEKKAGVDVRKYIKHPKPPSKQLQQKPVVGKDKSNNAKPISSEPEAPQTTVKLDAQTKQQPNVIPQPTKATSPSTNDVSSASLPADQATDNPDKLNINQLMGVETSQSPALIAKPVKSGMTGLSDERAEKIANQHLQQNQAKSAHPSIAGLQSTIAQLTNDRKTDQAKMAALTKQLDEANQHLTSLSKELKNSLAQLQTQLAALKQTHKEQQHVVSLTKQASQDYTVQAMIPGRAWLKDRSGKTITIARGQTLPGYGVVLQIDTNSGVIITSSGAILSYALGH